MTHCPQCGCDLSVVRENRNTQQDQWFDEFWPLMWRRYPQAQPKEPARKAYARVIKTEADHQLAMAAARREAPIQGAKEGRFRIMAATWLNQLRWRDEPPNPGSSCGQSRVIAPEQPPGSCDVCWGTGIAEHTASAVRFCGCGAPHDPIYDLEIIPSGDGSSPNHGNPYRLLRLLRKKCLCEAIAFP